MASRNDLSYSHSPILHPELVISSTSYSNAPTVLFRKARSPILIALRQSTEPISLLLLPE
jgi:hypothetical protein